MAVARPWPMASSYHALAPHLRDNFIQELVALIKCQPGCRISLHDFCYYYKSQFGKYFLIENYGYGAIENLLRTLPNVVKITKNKHETIVSLTSYFINDSAPQTKGDFIKELVDLISAAPGRYLVVEEFEYRYEKHFGRKLTMDTKNMLWREFKLKDNGSRKMKSLFMTISHVVKFTTPNLSDDSIIKLNPTFMRLYEQKVNATIPLREVRDVNMADFPPLPEPLMENKSASEDINGKEDELTKSQPRVTKNAESDLPSGSVSPNTISVNGNNIFSRFKHLLSLSISKCGIIPTIRHPHEELIKDVVTLINSQPGKEIQLKDFETLYRDHFNKKFDIKEHGHKKLEELFWTLSPESPLSPHVVKITHHTSHSSASLTPTYAKLSECSEEWTATKKLDNFVNFSEVLNSRNAKGIDNYVLNYKPWMSKNRSKSIKHGLSVTGISKGERSDHDLDVVDVVDVEDEVDEQEIQMARSLQDMDKNAEASYNNHDVNIHQVHPNHNYYNDHIHRLHPNHSYYLDYNFHGLHPNYNYYDDSNRKYDGPHKKQIESLYFTTPNYNKIRQFAKECVELLTLAPEWTIPFDKFVPTYHRHFGRQLRLSKYGFNNLLGLLKAVPDTVTVSVFGDADRPINLIKSPKAQLDKKPVVEQVQVERVQQLEQGRSKIFGRENCMSLLVIKCTVVLLKMPDCKMPLLQFPEAYKQHYGRDFQDTNFGLLNLFKTIPDTVRITGSTSAGYFMQLTEVARKSNLPHELNATATPNDVIDVEDEVDVREANMVFHPEDTNKNSKSDLQAQNDMSIQIDVKENISTMFAEQCNDIFGSEDRMTEFANECVQVLLEMPDCKMPLLLFPEAYKDHYDRDFMTKFGLLSLFKKIPDTVSITILNSSALYFIQLTEVARQSNMPLVLNATATPNDVIDVEDEVDVRDSFRAEDTNKNSKSDLRAQNDMFIQIEKENMSTMYAEQCNDIFGNEDRMTEFANECVQVLLEMPDCKTPLLLFPEAYKDHYDRDFTTKFGLLSLFKKIPDTVSISISNSSALYFIQLTEVARQYYMPQVLNATATPNDVTDVEDESDAGKPKIDGKQQEIDNKDEEDLETKEGHEVGEQQDNRNSKTQFLVGLLRRMRRFFGCLEQ